MLYYHSFKGGYQSGASSSAKGKAKTKKAAKKGPTAAASDENNGHNGRTKYYFYNYY